MTSNNCYCHAHPIAKKVSARKLYLKYPTYQSRLYLKYLGPRVQDSSNNRKVL